MAGGTIHVDEAALADLRDALATAGEDYKSDLARLTALIQEITSGDIQGDPANDLLAKYNAKEEPKASPSGLTCDTTAKVSLSRNTCFIFKRLICYLPFRLSCE